MKPRKRRGGAALPVRAERRPPYILASLALALLTLLAYANSFDSGFVLEDESILALIPEYDVVATNHIQPIFPQLVIQQIHNTLVARQLLPKGPDHF